jgi:methylase of polypeptide subunit release factors
MQDIRAHTALLEALHARDYRFITPTPLTHARVIARADKQQARDLRDVLGWSLPFSPGAIDAEIVALLRGIDALEDAGGGLLKSRVRVSSLDDDLFLHSAYPTTQRDAVFFGPDSYRFAAFIRAELPRFAPIGRLADIGVGSAVGAVAALGAAEIKAGVLTDINEAALALAFPNLMFASDRLFSSGARQAMDFAFRATSGLDGVEGGFDAIIANPPYIADAAQRAYRDGGAMHGAEVSLAWAKAAAEKLASGGVFLLYTGSAIVGGEDHLKAALHEALDGFGIAYRELDPDVFGEELEREDYGDVERIAVVGVVAIKR